MNGLLFPGQGSQSVGMGMDIYNELQEASVLLDRANDILGYDLQKIMFEGPEDFLIDTKYAQPAIYVCSAMYLEKVKKERIEYGFCAGHSLGEYDALLAAGVYDFETGLRLVSRRGEIMSRMNGKGTMAAVLGLSEDELKDYMEPDVVMANLNSKTQIVISGNEEAIDTVGEKIRVFENVKFKKLSVSAAFHSPQMAEAAGEMKVLIENAKMKQPECYVVSNVTGKPTKDLEEVRKNLANQITGQVRWYDTILSMKEEGVSVLYEVGYGEVLKKLNKTITFRPKCVSIEAGQAKGE